MEGPIWICLVLAFCILLGVCLLLKEYGILIKIEALQYEFEELCSEAAHLVEKERQIKRCQDFWVRNRINTIQRHERLLEKAPEECRSWVEEQDFLQTHYCEMPIMDKQFLDHIDYHLNMNDGYLAKSKFLAHFRTNMDFLVCFAWNFAEDNYRKMELMNIWKKDNYFSITREVMDFKFDFPVGVTACTRVPTHWVRFVSEWWEGAWRLVTMYPISSQ